jgi:hypothetical protein
MRQLGFQREGLYTVSGRGRFALACLDGRSADYRQSDQVDGDAGCPYIENGQCCTSFMAVCLPTLK